MFNLIIIGKKLSTTIQGFFQNFCNIIFSSKREKIPHSEGFHSIYRKKVVGPDFHDSGGQLLTILKIPNVCKIWVTISDGRFNLGVDSPLFDCH